MGHFATDAAQGGKTGGAKSPTWAVPPLLPLSEQASDQAKFINNTGMLSVNFRKWHAA
jgi:hypothetical protein